ncbi:MAG TPA: ABC transporter permease [Blastocatellia bacterium]|nr:ABC transporter permease [Blastocatellia bacterium]
MTWLIVFFSRLASLFRKRRMDQELDEEMREHLEMMIDDGLGRGLTREEAFRQSRLSFGGVEQTRETYRYQRGFPSVESLIQDLRYAVRVLSKKPVFTLISIFTLALGIGANTAIFSVVNAVMLRPLPYKDPSKIVVVWSNNTVDGNPRYPLTAANSTDLRDQNHVFAETGIYVDFAWNATLTGHDEPQVVIQSTFSPSLFQMLGVKPALGRTFLREEEQIGRDDVAVLSYGMWQRIFGGATDVIGKTIDVDNTRLTIVGVMPRGFYFLYQNVDVWIPLSYNTNVNTSFAITNRGTAAYGMIGRLKPGISIQQAQADLSTIASSLEKQYPDTNKGLGITLVPLNEQITENVRPALWTLLGAVGLVLLIACANVATLLLVRGSARKKEIAIRMALGASRWRVIRQLLTESVLLSVLGGVLGLLLAICGVSAILNFTPAEIPRQQEIGIDFWTLVFTIALSFLTGAVFGLAPALQFSKSGCNGSLKDGGRGSTNFARNGLRGALVVSEIALTLVLLVGAGLLIRSFVLVLHVDPGFNPNHVLTMSVSLPRQATAVPEAIAFYDELFTRIESLPGVKSAGGTTRLPLMAKSITIKVEIEGHPVPVGEEPEIEFRRVSRDYFSTLEVPLIKGRFFTRQDTPSTQPAVMINESAARRLWPNEDAVNKRIKVGNSPLAIVVGVVGDVKHFGLDAAQAPELYIPFDQRPPSSPFIVIRTSSDPMESAPAIRALVQSMNKDQALGTIQTMDQILDTSLAARRFNMTLLGLFAVLALFLSSIGLYGVISYSVSQRTQEIGIRMALGAGRIQIVNLIVGQGAAMALAGIAIGLIAAFGLTRIMSSLLFKVSATDPITFVAIPLLFAFVIMLASYIPARRATKVNPIVALRYD